jgi:tripartite-type tricarboxylate transporter receptor subunit TctC
MGDLARRNILAMVGTAMAASILGPHKVLAQQYPAKPIRLIAPFAAGGGSDVVARMLAKNLEGLNHWSMVVENRAGANGTLALLDLRNANPSGHDLAIGQADNLVFGPLTSKVSFDPIADFTPIAMICRSPLVFTVSAKSPYKTFDELLSAAKAAPNTINLASSGMGGPAHLSYELVRLKTQAQIQHVSYRGSGLALTDLIGGHINVVGSSIASAAGLLSGGQIRALAVSGEKRSSTLPDVPTLVELGASEFEVETWYGLIAPAKLPAELKQRLNADVNKAMAGADVEAVLREQGLELALGTSQEFEARLKRDVERWTKLTAQLGLKPT